jgi:hypothetical protein
MYGFDVCVKIISPYGRYGIGVGWLDTELTDDWYVRARCRFQAFKSGIVGDTSELGTGRVDFERAALNC